MMRDFLDFEEGRNFCASSALLIPEAVKLPDARMALWVREGSLMLKLTKGAGLNVTVLKEETRRPVGSCRGDTFSSDSEFCGERDECERVRGSDRMIVREFGTWRMTEVISLWRREEYWEGIVTPVFGSTMEEPSTCGGEAVGWGGVASGVASLAPGLVVRFHRR